MGRRPQQDKSTASRSKVWHNHSGRFPQRAQHSPLDSPTCDRLRRVSRFMDLGNFTALNLKDNVYLVIQSGDFPVQHCFFLHARLAGPWQKKSSQRDSETTLNTTSSSNEWATGDVLNRAW